MFDLIHNKLNDLAKQKEQLIAQLNAIAGAEQMLNELLGELEKGGESDGEHIDSD